MEASSTARAASTSPHRSKAAASYACVDSCEGASSRVGRCSDGVVGSSVKGAVRVCTLRAARVQNGCRAGAGWVWVRGGCGCGAGVRAGRRRGRVRLRFAYGEVARYDEVHVDAVGARRLQAQPHPQPHLRELYLLR